jgi:hypothetical protein
MASSSSYRNTALILASKWANPLTFKIQIRLHLAIYFLPSRAKAIKRLHGDNRPQSFRI